MPERKPVIPQGATPNPALSPGVVVGDFRQVMANIRDVVTAAGGKMEDVAKITCFLTDIANYPAYGKVRAETWPKDPPASSTVVVAGLVRPELLVEVEAIVRLPD